jgi:chorismate dehydratase
MTQRVRVGAVSYLNTRPLVLGLEQGMGAKRIDLSYGVPSALASRLAEGELDLALLPTIELARIPDLSVAPGLAITSRGPAASVVLLTKKPLDEVESVALDPESRTSNALVQVLFADAWRRSPEFVMGSPEVVESLATCDAVVRIGDKALFDDDPPETTRIDLGEEWMRLHRLPFVFAVWAARPGVLDRELYEILHASLREGRSAIGLIADDYTYRGTQHPEVARRYLEENIRYRLGDDEMRSLRAFLSAAGRLGLAPMGAKPALARFTLTSCDVATEGRR